MVTRNVPTSPSFFAYDTEPSSACQADRFVLVIVARPYEPSALISQGLDKLAQHLYHPREKIVSDTIFSFQPSGTM